MLNVIKVFIKNNNKKIFYLLYLSVCAVFGVNLDGLLGLIFFILWSLVGWFLLMRESDKPSICKYSRYWLIVPLLILVISRALPFALYGNHPLGYDTGFVKYNISQERSNSLAVLGPLRVTESTGARIVNKMLIELGFSDDFIMYWLYGLIVVLIGLMVYLLVRSYFDDSTAIVAFYLYSISAVQYLFYWYYFWKNALCLLLVLVVFYCLEKKTVRAYVIALPLIVFVLISQKSIAVLLLASLLVYYFFTKRLVWQKTFFLLLAVMTLFIAWYYREVIVGVWQLMISGFRVEQDVFKIKEGQFIAWRDYLSMSYFYFPLAMIGWWYNRRKLNLFFIFGFISAIIVLSQFIFYKRFFVYFDLLVIVYAASAIRLLYAKMIKYSSRALVVMIFIFVASLLIINFAVLVVQTKPLITKESLENIVAMQDESPGLSIFSQDSNFMPWLYGFSGHPLISPGWTSVKWNYADWNRYWLASSSEKRQLLTSLNMSLILYNSNNDQDLVADECFQKINEHFYLFSCNFGI